MRHLLLACLLVTAVVSLAGCAGPLSKRGCTGCDTGCPSCSTCGDGSCGSCANGACVQYVRGPMLANKRMYGRTAVNSAEGMCPCPMCKGHGRGCLHCGGRGFGPCGLYGHHHDLAYRKEAPPHGPQSAHVGYPYYTTRGPRDFLVDNPPSIGP